MSAVADLEAFGVGSMLMVGSGYLIAGLATPPTYIDAASYGMVGAVAMGADTQ